MKHRRNFCTYFSRNGGHSGCGWVARWWPAEMRGETALLARWLETETGGRSGTGCGGGRSEVAGTSG